MKFKRSNFNEFFFLPDNLPHNIDKIAKNVWIELIKKIDDLRFFP